MESRPNENDVFWGILALFGAIIGLTIMFSIAILALFQDMTEIENRFDMERAIQMEQLSELEERILSREEEMLPEE